MRQFINWRVLALLLALAHLWRLSHYDRGLWYVLLFDGLALVFINFAKEIDDITFGQWTPDAGKITAHTPAFMIAGFGWLMIVAMTFGLFFTDWLKAPAGS
jgi:hypothetical protein